MSRTRFLLLAIILLCAALLFSAGAGTSVGQSAYPVAPMSISPDTIACLGTVETFSGGNASPKAGIRVFMEKADGDWPSATVGTATAGPDGKWTTTTKIPTLGIADDGNQTAMIPGAYLVQAEENGITIAQAQLEATDCKNLPATGPEIGWLAVAGLAILAIAGSTFYISMRQG